MRGRVARRVLALSGLGSVLALFASARAFAGTDVFSNIAPASPLGSAAEFLRYPLSHYGLDKHFSAISTSLTGGVDASGPCRRSPGSSPRSSGSRPASGRRS
jgi:hypothetical protein